MLLGIDPLLAPDLLFVLASMGHGDTLVIADANFPSASIAARTVHGRALRTDADALATLRAILTVLPVDTFGSDPVVTMAVVDDPHAVPPVVLEASELLRPAGVQPSAMERFAFYDLAARSYAVLQTSERRLYGNFIVRKGVVPPA